jgi:hypothetical protein
VSYDGKDQPCQNYKPQMEGNEHAMWENAHTCYGCAPERDSSVSFCVNCYSDHHEGGYASCDHLRCKPECKEGWLKKLAGPTREGDTK